jgi:hypothetical protein
LENDAEHIGIDPKHDFYDRDHMNVYGALKFTDYLAEKLMHREGLEADALKEDLTENWQDAVTATNQLYRYCDDLMSKSEEARGAQEDVVTLATLGEYSGATIKTK